ncbi:MAG: PEP-CTERM sorting domain-containing protein [Desulfuromonadaceae bacterium]|nr:PEP-CTERM sorting domain-containing protein [Desulfuromonadaceae bacterium]
MSDEIRPHSDKNSVSPKKRVAAIVLLFLAVLAVGLLIRTFLPQKKAYVSKEVPVQVAVAHIEEPDDANSEISGQYYGLCAKNSTHSVEDFRKTVQSDPVLAAHFSEFNWSVAKLGKQEQELWTFVSYRKGPVIKQTTKPVKLPKGDQYVTDGVRFVRTYCCNDYVAAPAPRIVSMITPVERVDGPSRRVEKSDPPDPPSLAEALPAFLNNKPNYFVSPPPSPQYSDSHSHVSPPFEPYSSASLPEEKPPTATPEPGTFYLMVAGLAAFSIFGLLRRKRIVGRNHAKS